MYSSFLGILNKRWITSDLCRYALLYDQNLAIKIKSKLINNGFINNADTYKIVLKTEATERRLLNVLTLQKIVLHSNSGKLLVDPSNSSNIDLAFSTISCQTPSKIYARKNVSGFKLSKNALLGIQANLRCINAYEFFYKWLFIAASELKSNSKIHKNYKVLKFKKKVNNINIIFALNNVFVFNELDSLDYHIFSNLSGFEIKYLFNSN